MVARIVVTDRDRRDIAELDDFQLDLAYGEDENDFELTPGAGAPMLAEGSLAYIEGTAYGGIVDEIGTKVTRAGAQTVYSGRTWSGILAARIVMPPAGADHYAWSGEANACIRDLVSRLGLQDTFTAATSDSGIEIDYEFERFCDAWSGLCRALLSSGARPELRCAGGAVEIGAVPCSHWGDEIDSDLIDFDITREYRCVNHLVCVGDGELQDRAVVHFYADEEGNVSHVQTFFGADEREALYEYSNADEAKLEEEGAKKLAEHQTQGEVSVTVRDSGPDMGVGDTVTGRDNRIGQTVTASVKKKVVKVQWGALSVSYEVDDATETGSVTSGAGESSGGGGHAYYAGEGLSLEGYTFSADVTAEDISRVEEDASEALEAASGAASEAARAVKVIASSGFITVSRESGSVTIGAETVKASEVNAWFS